MKNLKTMRKNMLLKQYESANILGISADYLGMIENGRKKPGRELLIKMAQLYKQPIEDIFLALERTNVQ